MMIQLTILFLSIFPIREYSDVVRGLILEYADNSKEFIGYITEDDQLIIVNTGTSMMVQSKALVLFGGKVYAQLDGPALKHSYNGMITNKLGTFIPIKATVHSHNPQCREISSSGCEYDQLSEEDKQYAARYSQIKHYVIACKAFAEYNSKGWVSVNRYITFTP
jgi:hypothetical protein